MVRFVIAALIAVVAGVTNAQTPAPAAAAKDAPVDCSKAGVYYRQCENSMRARDPCYGKKDADLAACKSTEPASRLRVRDCGVKSGDAKSRCEANNTRDKEAAVKACGGKAGTELDSCMKSKMGSTAFDERNARQAEAAKANVKPAAAAAKSAHAPQAAGTAPPARASKAAPAVTGGTTTNTATGPAKSVAPSHPASSGTSAAPSHPATSGTSAAPADATTKK